MVSMKTVALSVVVWLAVGSIAFADVQLSFRDGHVSIVAKDATVGQILAEWAKIGQTTFDNVGRIPGVPLTIVLENVSEGQALDVVLRAVSGYIASSRAIALPNASRFSRITVLPTSTAVPTSAASLTAKVSAPPESQPPAYPEPPSAYVPPPADTANDVNDEPPSGMVDGTPNMNPHGPVPNTAQQSLETVDPRTFKLPAGLLSGGGVAVPGTIFQPRPGAPR